MNSEPIWRMVQECARQLTREGTVPFTRQHIIACIQKKNPRCAANSINPIIQGLTDNLKGGAPGADGKRVLHSVGRGTFVLYSKKDDKSRDLLERPRKASEPNDTNSGAASVGFVPDTESELRDFIVGKLRSALRARPDIELAPEGRLPYLLPGGHTLYHASDILATKADDDRCVSIELKYKSAVTDQFKCRSCDASHLKQEYGDRLLSIMLFVKSSTGISIAQAERICYSFDRFFGLPISEISDPGAWEQLADDIRTFFD